MSTPASSWPAGTDDGAGSRIVGQRPGEVDRLRGHDRDPGLAGRDAGTTPRRRPVPRPSSRCDVVPPPSTRPTSPVTRSAPPGSQVPARPGPRSGPPPPRPGPRPGAGSSSFAADGRRQAPAAGRPAGSARPGRAPARTVSCSSAAARSATVPPSPPSAAGQGDREHAQVGQAVPVVLTSGPGRPARAPDGPGRGTALAARARLQAPHERQPRPAPLRPVADRRLQGQLLLGGGDRHPALLVAAAHSKN